MKQERKSLAIAVLLLLGGCSRAGYGPTPSQEKSILRFDLLAADNAVLPRDALGTVGDSTVQVVVPFGTDISNLTPHITISGVSIAPEDGERVDFSAGHVPYTVTAADRSTKSYSVIVDNKKSDSKDIVSFRFLKDKNPVLAADVSGSIAGSDISVVVPNGTNISHLSPTIDTTGVSVSPGSDEYSDFSGGPLVFTVTAADTTTRLYTAKVDNTRSSSKAISTFQLLSTENPELGVTVTGSIAGTSISMTVPADVDIAALNPDIQISGASVEPADGADVDFSGGSRVFTVTAADGTSADYTVTLTVSDKRYKIAFTSNRDGSDQIYVMGEDGANQLNLSNNIANDQAPDWSPDGSKIAFVSDRDTRPQVYVMNEDGSGQLNLSANSANCSSPDWSPDGAKIVYSSNQSGAGYDIFAMAADGTNQTNLSQTAQLGFENVLPLWSPDGSRISYLSRDVESHAYTMNANGTNQVRVSNQSDTNVNIGNWSSDSTTLVFHASRDASDEICSVRADGTDSVALSNSIQSDIEPQFSPDGSKIVFLSNRDGTFYEIYVMNSDGTNQRKLTANSAWVRFPRWSPDGGKIAFLSTHDDVNYEIYIMNPDGTDQVRLTHNTASDGNPVWRPLP